ARKPALRSIQKLRRSSGHMLRRSTHTGSTPSFRRNTGRSGGNTSPDLLEVTCGCGLETCPTQSEVRYGKSTSRSWPFQQDFLAFEAVPRGRYRRARREAEPPLLKLLRGDRSSISRTGAEVADEQYRTRVCRYKPPPGRGAR